MTSIILFLAQVSVSPDPNALPGRPQLQTIVNGSAFIASIVCVLGLLVGGATMAISKSSNNSRYEQHGKTMLYASAGGALVVGAAAGLINFFVNLGQGVH